MKRLFLFFLSCSFVQADPKKAEPVEIRYPGRVDGGGFYLYQRQGFPKKNTAFGEIDLFIPLLQNDQTIFFLDLRALDFYAKSLEGNFGLGVRHLFTSYPMILGFYSFFDYKRSQNRNNFTQITGGVELKTNRWTIDANGYFPIGDTQKKASQFDIVQLGSSGGLFQNIFFKEGMEVALWGFDAEVGYELFEGFSLFAGGFYFDRSGAQHLGGPMLRSRYVVDFRDNASTFFDELFIEAGFSYDRVRKSRVYAGFGLSWYFGGDKKRAHRQGIRKRMTEYVRRDLDVITSSNPKIPFTLATNPDGSIITVQVAKTLEELNTGISGGANVLAIDGTIIATSDLTLGNGVTVTGGRYTFGNNITIELSKGGTLQAGGVQINVNKNNTFRDLNLQNVVILGSAGDIGNFVVDNLTFNQTIIPTAINLFDNGVSNDGVVSITNSIFNMQTTSVEGIVYVARRKIGSSGTLRLDEICNNTFNVKATSNNTIAIHAEALVRNGESSTVYFGLIKNNQINISSPSYSGAIGIQVDTFSDLFAAGLSTSQVLNVAIQQNQVNIEGGSDHNGIKISNKTEGASTNTAQLVQVDSIIGNSVTMKDVVSSYGIVAQNNVTGTQEANMTLSIKTVTNNAITFTNGTNNVGVYVNNINSDPNSITQISIGEQGGFYHNTIANTEASATGILLNTPSGDNTIHIEVNKNGKGLSKVNGNTKVELTGTESNITIDPSK